MENINTDNFSQAVISWQKQYGRHDFPWQKDRNVYRVWLSEIMLQQTQVNTVLPYYNRFIDRFPDVFSLAVANIDEVLFLWSGLGYYSRARNLHRSARIVVSQFKGVFPNRIEELQKLPGIGRSTAGAIMVLAYKKRASILDGNVKRVLARYFAIYEPINLGSTEKNLWRLSDELVPDKEVIPYTQGMMDLGAIICKRSQPLCERCPLQQACMAYHKQVQHVLPNREKQKEKPVRQSDFVLITQHQLVLLKQRPKVGIWGGLWSLPQRTELEQLKPQPIIAMGPKWLEFRHTFSHFYLDCRIYQATIDGLQALPMGWIWYNSSYSVSIGLAAPIKKVIRQWFLLESSNKSRSSS